MPDFTTSPALLLLTAALGYLLGSVPFGVVMARLFGLGDLRRIGSGNIGATNVLRTGNKPAAFLTLVLDAAKGAVAVLLARLALGEDAAQVAGIAAFAGHCYSILMRFNGGKGVATFLGTLLALAWPVGLSACAIWLAAAFAFGISSLAALLLGRTDAILFALLLAALIVLRHAPNIARLLNGTEPRIGASKVPPA